MDDETENAPRAMQDAPVLVQWFAHTHFLIDAKNMSLEVGMLQN
jgi:hypothetical protein